ncbi:Vacuolar calcium ion transporter [Sporothrix eucalyptigena]|uniref:Vacuolar calcium ion transporter n=1 Tax=Sporothrix eucalyptigena TaxID=1812306 RepID=A0ABP0AYX1_9PEZI
MSSDTADESLRLLPSLDADENMRPRCLAGHGAMIFAAASAALRWVARQSKGIYALLVCVPLGFVADHFQWHPVAVWTFNFLAIIPLSALISRVSDELSDAWGDLIGGLVNATFGNAVELIVGFLAVHHGEIKLAQSMMLGSILNDILGVLGVCMISAAGKSRTNHLSEAVTDTLSSLMTITAVALILPTALYSTFTNTADIGEKILSFSRGTAGILLAIYGVYIYFQMVSHADIFSEDTNDHNQDEDAGQGQDQGQVNNANLSSGVLDAETNRSPENQAAALQRQHDDSQGNGLDDRQDDGHDDDDESPDTEHPASETYRHAAILVLSGATIMWCTHSALGSLDETAHALNLTKTFFATVLLPIASNAPELSQVAAALRANKANFAIGVIVGSILQIALFVLPTLVLLGWVVGKPMTLYFETSATCFIFLAVLLVNQVLQEGTYTYFHGVMLLSMYVTPLPLLRDASV